jgi:hypothetical protein
MLLEGRDWYGYEGASPEQIEELRKLLSVEVPATYWELLRETNGGEGPVPTQPYNFCLDPTGDVAHRVATRNYGQPDFDGFLIFGCSGGGDYYAFDLRNGSPWPIVVMDMVGGSDSAEVIAPDFETFLGMVGVERS